MKPVALTFILVAAAIAEQAETPEALFARAEDLRRRGQRDEAVAVYQQVIVASPEHVLAHKYYQEIMIDLGHKQEVVDYYKALLDSDPQKPLHHLLVGKLLDGDDALAEFRKCVELDPKFFWGHWAVAGVLLRQGKVAEAEAEARTAQGLEDNAFSRTMLGAVLTRKAADDKEHARAILEEAKRELQRAISLDRGYDPAYLTLGMVLANLKDFRQAIAALEMGQKLNPAERGFADALGQVASENGHGLIAEAVKLAEVRGKAEKDGKPQEAIELLLTAKKRAQGAVISFEKSLEYAPDGKGTREKLAAARFILGQLLLAEVGDLLSSGSPEAAVSCADEAIAEMKKAVEVDPSNAKLSSGPAAALVARAGALHEQGKAFLGAGKKAEARASLEKALADAQAAAGTPNVDAKIQEAARKLASNVLESLAKARE